MKRRIAIGGIWHETNTFAAAETGLRDFESYQLARGDALLARYTDTRTELGGAIEAAPALGLDLHPCLYAGAVPSGTIAASAFTELAGELVLGIERAKPLDGVLLTLHGAAVADGTPDADLEVLARVRSCVGERTPIALTLDFHANIDRRLVDAADLVVGYDTYPHVDMAERGFEAMRGLARILAGETRPIAAFRKVPLLTVPQMQSTQGGPVAEVMALVHAIEGRDGIVGATLAMGFPYADVARLGAAVVVYADEAARAEAAADEVAGALWRRRDAFDPALVAIEEGVALAVAASERPVVLVEPADNVGGGSAGDGAAVLAALLAAGADRAVIVIADPPAVQAAERAGAGGRFHGPVGGRTDDRHGPPILLEGRVRFVREARYRHRGSYMTGYETSMGPTAVVDAGGVQVVLTTLRTMPFDGEQLRCLGIEPAEQAIIVVKSAIAWRAAYGDVAKRVIFLDSPGICASNLDRFDYAHRPRPLYPFEREFAFERGGTER
jgi:microcystin degradation protein MlrC